MRMSKRGLDELINDPNERSRLEARFWRKVAVAGEDECWLWTSRARHKFGYGAFTVTTGHVKTAPRVAWTLKNGPIPEGGHVLHSCDIPACCNPKHLRIGTPKDNADDKVTRNRQSRVRHSPDTIKRIRDARAANPIIQTEDARLSRSAAMRKRWSDPDWRERFSRLMSGPNNPRFGKRPPEHQIEAVKRGHRVGFKHTAETREKMRAAALARYRRA